MLFLILTRSLLIHGRVKTTIAKAKAVQPLVEKLITKAKRATRSALIEISKTLADKASYTKLLEMAKERFMARSSGYTRIVKLGKRSGDASEMVYFEFVDAAPVKEEVKAKAQKIQEAEVVTEAKPKVVKKSAPKKNKKTKK